MAFSGGTFSRTFDCTTDRDNGVKILASKFDTELDGFATGLSTCILKDGTQTCTAAIPFAEGLTVPDNKTIVLGTNSDITIQYDESTNDSLEIAANVEGAALGIVLKADQGDDNADQHKLNIADGGVLTLQSKISGGFVTYLTHTPNATVADSTTAVAGNLTVGGDLTLGSGAVISEAELEAIDGVTAGTVTASKAVIVDSNKDIASFRNVTLTGELDAGSLDISGDADIDGTLEADAMTLNGTAITATATLDTGISNNNVPKFTSGVADDDFLRVAGTAIEGRSASEVLSDIAALPLAGGSMTGAVTITTADNTTQLTLTSTDADASEGPRLDLHRNSASPADNDSIGAIRGLAENDASENIIYTEIQSKIIDVTDGTEDGEINLQVRRNGTLRDAFIVGSGSVIANEGGEDIDFRIEGDNETHAFFLQGSSGFIGVNESSPQNQLHITTSDFKALQLEGPRPTAFFKETDGNANENYQIRLNGGSLQFQSQNDAQSSAVDRMTIDSSGFVGIGETAPVTPLTIATTNKLGSTFTGTTNGEGLTVTQTDFTSGNYISLVEAAFDDSGDGNPNVRIGAMFDGGGSNLAFGTSNSYGSGITNTALFVDSTGNIGIGTASPATATGGGIDIERAAGASVRIDDTTNSVTGELQVYSQGMNLATVTNHNLIFSTNNVERGRFLAGGGLTFNGDTAAANALDDYEEGLSDVTVAPNTSGSITLYGSTNQLAYTKIGRLVHVQCELQVQAVSSPVGTFITVSGLPFNIGAVGDLGERFGGAALFHPGGGSASVKPLFGFSGTSFQIFVDASTTTVNTSIDFTFSYLT